MTHHYKTLALLALPLLLTSCASQDLGFGETVKQNIALQVINPDPQYKDETVPGASGDHAAQATERYREGKVTQPPPTVTSTLSATGRSGQSTSPATR
jgi:hypothetical protein